MTEAPSRSLSRIDIHHHFMPDVFVAAIGAERSDASRQFRVVDQDLRLES